MLVISAQSSVGFFLYVGLDVNYIWCFVKILHHLLNFYLKVFLINSLLNYIVSSIGEYRVRGELCGLVGDVHGGGV